MIDIHCHILPGMDDGAKSLSETLAMGKKAVKQGIHTIIATPHHNNGAFINERDAIIAAVDYVNAKLIEEQIPLVLLPGQEIKIYEDMVDDLKHGNLLPLNETTGYVMVELPNNHVPSYTTQLVFDMQIAGFKPIIVHPEENDEFLANPNKLYEMVKNGALTQINADSIMGNAGKKAEKFAIQLLEANLTHFIASNAHNVKKRGFVLQQAMKIINKQLGSATVGLLSENSELLVQDRPVIKDAPIRLNSKRWKLFKK